MQLLLTTPTILAIFSGMITTVDVVHADPNVCKPSPGNICMDYYNSVSFINVNNSRYCLETRDDSVCDGSFFDYICGAVDENGTAIPNITDVCGLSPDEIFICTPAAIRSPSPNALCRAAPNTSCMDYDIDLDTAINVNDTAYCRENDSVCDGSWGGPIWPSVNPEGNSTDVCGFPPNELNLCTGYSSATSIVPVSATTVGISLVTVMVGGIINVLL